MLLMHANTAKKSKKRWPAILLPLPALKDTTTGDTLCDPAHPVILERMEFPDPVIEVAVEPKTKADQEKMGVALSVLAAEDPSFRVRRTRNPARPSSKAWANLHLDILLTA